MIFIAREYMDNLLDRFSKLLELNDIPHYSIRKPGAEVPIDFKDDATPEQKALALQLYGEFDWSPPQPLKSIDEFKAAFLGTGARPDERQALWDAMLAGVLLWFANTHPDTMQEILDGIGVPFKVRKDK